MPTKSIDHTSNDIVINNIPVTLSMQKQCYIIIFETVFRQYIDFMVKFFFFDFHVCLQDKIPDVKIRIIIDFTNRYWLKLFKNTMISIKKSQSRHAVLRKSTLYKVQRVKSNLQTIVEKQQYAVVLICPILERDFFNWVKLVYHIHRKFHKSISVKHHGCCIAGSNAKM